MPALDDKARLRRAVFSLDLDCTAKLVALYIIECVGGCPSQSEIAEACGFDKRTAMRAVKRMEDRGFLLVTRGSGRVNDYQVVLRRDGGDK